MIIHGSGRHFSSGADIDELLETIKNGTERSTTGNITRYPPFLMENNRSFLFFDRLTVPVIAAIRGVCLGSALELALFCHIRICGKGSVFALPETTFNLIPGCGGIQKIISRAGLARGMELVLRGNNFSAEEALQWNIVDRIVPKKDVVDIATDLAKKICDNYKRENIQEYIKNF